MRAAEEINTTTFAMRRAAGAELISGDPDRDRNLVFENPDGTRISVPNFWYNQPAAAWAKTLRRNAERNRLLAVCRITDDNGVPWNPALVADLKAKADELDARADRLEAQGCHDWELDRPGSGAEER